VIAAARLPAETVSALATIPFAIAAGIITFGTFASLRAGRRAGIVFANYLGLGLEFFLAAGLIRLAGADSFAMLGIAAAIIATRRILVLGVRLGARAFR
jgi:hypothetical protein